MWARASSVLHRRVGPNVLVLIPDVGETGAGTVGDDVVSLQGAAALAWHLLEVPGTRRDLVDALEGAVADGDVVGLAAEGVGPAVDEALRMLADAGIIEARHPANVPEA